MFADEATSALDEATESLLYQRLLALVGEQGAAWYPSGTGRRWLLSMTAAGCCKHSQRGRRRLSA